MNSYFIVLWQISILVLVNLLQALITIIYREDKKINKKEIVKIKILTQQRLMVDRQTM